MLCLTDITTTIHSRFFPSFYVMFDFYITTTIHSRFFFSMFRQVQIDDVGRFVFGQTKGRDTRDQHVVEVLQEIEGP